MYSEQKYLIASLFILGFIVFGISDASGQIDVTVKDTSGVAGSDLEIPVQVGQLDGEGVLSYEFTLTYDENIVSIDSIIANGTVSEDISINSNTSAQGTLRVAGADDSEIGGSDSLITLYAHLNNTGTSELGFEAFQFNEGDPAANARPGTLEVTGNTAPTQSDILSPKDTTIALEGLPNTVHAFVWNASSDPEGYAVSYRLQIAMDSSFAGQQLLFSRNAGETDTTYRELTIGDMDSALAENGVSEGDTAQVLTRVNATDGVDTTRGGISGYKLVRGEIQTSFSVSEIKSLSDSAEVSISGVMTTPDYGETNGRFFVQDATGGVNVSYPGKGGNETGNTPFAAKDSLRIDGIKVTTPNNRIQVLAREDTTYKQNASLPEPEAITATDWNNEQFDGLFGSRVEVNSLQLVDENNWPTDSIPGTEKSTVVEAFTVEEDTLGIKIDQGQSYFDGSSTPPDVFKAIGVLDRTMDNEHIWIFFEDDIQQSTSISKPNNESPDQYRLYSNYPNPFNPATTIKFALPERSHVKVEVFNSIGRKVKTLLNKNLAKGTHTVTFEGGSYSSGMYLYRIEAGDSFKDTRKMLLVK